MIPLDLMARVWVAMPTAAGLEWREGEIRGRTIEDRPRYDVAVDGRIVTNVEQERVRVAT